MYKAPDPASRSQVITKTEPLANIWRIAVKCLDQILVHGLNRYWKLKPQLFIEWNSVDSCWAGTDPFKSTFDDVVVNTATSARANRRCQRGFCFRFITMMNLALQMQVVFLKDPSLHELVVPQVCPKSAFRVSRSKSCNESRILPLRWSLLYWWTWLSFR